MHLLLPQARSLGFQVIRYLVFQMPLCFGPVGDCIITAELWFYVKALASHSFEYMAYWVLSGLFEMNTNTVISKKDLYITSPPLLFLRFMNVSVSFG